MTVQVADVHGHVQRLISVVKLATMLEECATEEQRYLCVFCQQKDQRKGYS
jgi:hypothetical protein